tara:strand:+ start:905 stop:1405 length:501 start_codon:yes stop_codon:yes gene_type:complete
MSYGAGVMIITKIKGEVYVLLGKDKYDTYSDFGGLEDKKDNKEKINTASRECYEETCGSLLDITKLKEQLRKCEYIESKSFMNKPYYMYILSIKYENKICNDFYKIREKIKGNFSYIYEEKKEIEWILLKKIIEKKVRLRNIFEKTIDNHRKSILNIAYNNRSSKK